MCWDVAGRLEWEDAVPASATLARGAGTLTETGCHWDAPAAASPGFRSLPVRRPGFPPQANSTSLVNFKTGLPLSPPTDEDTILFRTGI